MKKFHLGTGRRKSSVARVRVAEGSGKILVNDRPYDQFFTEEKDRGAVVGPLILLDMRNRLDVFVKRPRGRHHRSIRCHVPGRRYAH